MAVVTNTSYGQKALYYIKGTIALHCLWFTFWPVGYSCITSETSDCVGSLSCVDFVKKDHVAERFAVCPERMVQEALGAANSRDILVVIVEHYAGLLCAFQSPLYNFLM